MPTTLLLTAFLAFAIAWVIIPPILAIALKRNLFDRPVERSSHKVPTPSLGGVGIFGGIFIAVLLGTPMESFAELQYLLAAMLIIFLTGFKDDLAPMRPWRKLVAQFLAALIIVGLADFRIESLHGFFGWESALPYSLSFVLSVFTVLVITNAFNLIDGINGLAASIGILVLAVFGTWFAFVGKTAFATLSFAGIGAYVAFLRYNLIPPTRTFMGDSGSLVLGTIASAMALVFIETNAALPVQHALRLESGAVVAMTIISIPLFDTLRVFITRVARGHSPFEPDRRHIHHLLIDYGFSHAAATGLLVLFNVGIIGLVVALQGKVDQHWLFLAVLGVICVSTYLLHRAVIQKNAESEIEVLAPVAKVEKEEVILESSY